MRGLKAIFNHIIRFFRRPPDMGGKLQAKALEDALKEARFLRGHHAVDARHLEEGEEPGPPRRADQ